MTISAKLGITSIVLLLIVLVPAFLNWRLPVASVCIWLSSLFGLLAARQGSKWWLTIPGIVLGGVAFGFYLALHSY